MKSPLILLVLFVLMVNMLAGCAPGRRGRAPSWGPITGCMNEFASPARRSDWSPVNSSLIASGWATYTSVPKTVSRTVKTLP